MGAIAILFFLSLGVFLAWLFDMAVLQRTPVGNSQIEGYTLLQMLKKSKSYENLRSTQEISHVRIPPDHSDRRSGLVEHRDGGDGCEVLQLRSRK